MQPDSRSAASSRALLEASFLRCCHMIMLCSKFVSCYLYSPIPAFWALATKRIENHRTFPATFEGRSNSQRDRTDGDE
jgi:hypothetical protein